MKNTLYVYSQESLFKIIKEMLSEYVVLALNDNEINNEYFKNNNILLVLEDDITNQINKSFFSNNKAMIFFSSKQKLLDINTSRNANFFYGQSSVKKFFDEINTCFFSKTITLRNIEILDEKITNIESKLSTSLTPLEKEILIVLFQNKKIKREYLLEEILKIKKNIETKTIESHLTRIRRKLLKIKSEIQITSKEDVFYLDT